MNLPIRQYFQLLSAYLRPQWTGVALLTVLLFSSIGLQLYTPQIVRRFIDMAAEGANSELLVRTGAIFLVVTLANQFVRMASAYITEDVKWRATNWLRNDLSRHCLRLDMSFHNEQTPGVMIERIDGDVNELSNFFSQFVIRVLGNALLLVGVIVLLYREDWRFGVVYTGYAVAMLIVLTATVRFGVPFWKERRQAMSEMYGLIEEWLGGTEDIRASGGVDFAMLQLQRAIYQLFIATRKAFLVGTTTWGLNSVFLGIGMALALGVGGILYSAGEITIGTVYLVLAYATSLQRPLEELARELKDLQAATAAIERIQELFDTDPKVIERTQPAAMPTGPLSVVFDQVTFGYEADDPILHNVTFDLQPGQVMGLLGRTGSGKTTLTRLLFRLYDPGEGMVRLGDRDLTEVTLTDLRSRVGIVTQDVQLFQATIRDNLTFFDPSISDERVLEALEILGLDRWYASMEDGLDTWLATGSHGLSAGEAQLLAFTRVFLKDPGLIILDEASSRLDPVTEQLIEHAINRLLQNRTAIIVAHRLTTVQRADQIMILRDGEVAESGDRISLLSNPDSDFSRLMQSGMEQVLA